MNEAGLAEMHLAIDDARQDVKAGGGDDGRGARRRQRADRADASLDDPHVARADPVVIDERAALDEKIEGPRHVRAP